MRRLTLTLETLTTEDATFLPPRLTYFYPGPMIYKSMPHLEIVLAQQCIIPNFFHPDAVATLNSLIENTSSYPDPRTVERYSS